MGQNRIPRIEKLKDLERALNALSGFMCDLVELESIPNLIIPPGFDSRDDYRKALISDIHIARTDFQAMWNEISGLAYSRDDVRVINPFMSGFSGSAWFIELRGHHYIVNHNGTRTGIFRCEKDGNLIDWNMVVTVNGDHWTGIDALIVGLNNGMVD